MSYLSKLPDDVRQLVISLPFRVGYFLSVSDQTGGDDADEAEQRALHNIVAFYVEDTVKSEFAHEVMIETLNQRARWDTWKDNIAAVPDECERVVYMMQKIIDDKEIAAYKSNLLDVAVAVAEAYCEAANVHDPLGKIKLAVQRVINQIAAALSDDEQKRPEKSLINISQLEREAIALLALRLDIKFTL